MSLLLSVRSISKSFGLRMLFRGISIAFDDSERIGLIGPNGAGKSTFLNILAGLEQPDEGELVMRRGLRLAYLPQQDLFAPGASAERVLVDALASEPMDEHQKHATARIMLGRLEFADPEQPADAMSGGWRKRLAIGRALVGRPDLLLLDEPTNHLDLEGINWLQGMLKNAPFAFLLVSHDRYLLEEACNRTVELNRAFPEGYFSINGPYSMFLEKRDEFLVAQKAQQTSVESRVRREVEWLKRGAKARTTKAKGRIEAAHEMMAELDDLKQRNAAGKAITIDFSATNRQTRKLMVATGVSKTLGGRALFKDLDLILSPGMKLGLVGPNGSGKSTLLRILSGEIETDGGQIRRAEGLRIVRFEQDRAQLNPSATLRQTLAPQGDVVTYRDNKMHISSWARQFLFRLEQLDLPVGDLSGGEQSRVLIANLMLRPADLLILDEPTNDLDIPTLEVLEESLEEFVGALVLVTHDRFMLDRLCTDILGLDGRGNAGHYADVEQWERARAVFAESAAEAKKPAPKAVAVPKLAAKRLTYMEQRELEQMEGKILEAETELEKARKEMAEPGVMSNRDRMAAACQRVHDAEERVRGFYDRWAQLEEKRQASESAR